MWSRVLLEKLTGLKPVKKFPRNLWNPKDHYHIQKCPPSVPIISQISPVHTAESHFLKTYPNMFLPFMPGPTQWSLSLRFLHQNPVQASPLPYTHYMHSSHFCRCFNRTILGEQYRSLNSSLCSFLHSPVTALLQSPTAEAHGQGPQKVRRLHCTGVFHVVTMDRGR